MWIYLAFFSLCFLAHSSEMVDLFGRCNFQDIFKKVLKKSQSATIRRNKNLAPYFFLGEWNLPKISNTELIYTGAGVNYILSRFITIFCES